MILNHKLLVSICLYFYFHCCFPLMLETTRRTVLNYEGRSVSYHNWSVGTEALAASEIRKRFVNHISYSSSVLRILDVGCGPGRDLKAFLSMGYIAVGIEPSPSFCRIARESCTESSCIVYEGDICDTKLIERVVVETEELFDGAFALCSLFHIPIPHLGTALQNIKTLLKPNGVLLTSFPVCSEQQGDDGRQGADGRWHTSLSVSAHKDLLRSNGFTPLETDGDFRAQIYNGEWTCVVSRVSG